MTQKCGRCKQEKDVEEGFAPSYRGKAGTWCRSCVTAYARGESVTVAHDPVTCQRCGRTFVPRQVKRNSAGFCSRECKDGHRVESGKARDQYLRRKYGISAEDYDRMLAAQGGGCGICGKKPEEQTRYSKYLHVDHDHTTGAVRGLLCDEHNLLLGRWGDGVELLQKAIEYLTRKE